MGKMESSDILDDKDSGPDVQLNLPASVMSRIDELMGGTEQFDNDQFDAVAYINRMFPTEQSLSGVESAAARCEFQLAGVRLDVRRLVRAQHAQRAAGHAALLAARRCIADLALQVADINKRAERSESLVREITLEIKQLDCAKWNLTSAITALNHLHLLVGGVATLRTLAAGRRYSELVLPLQAIMEVLQHLEDYRDIGELSALRDEVLAIRRQLAEQILADFKEAFTGAGAKGGVSARSLAAACGAADALEPQLKRELLDWFVGVQLQEYEHLFSPEQECAWLAHVERRYAWLKRHLLALEDALAGVFPLSWRISERIAHQFCKRTRAMLGELLAARRVELDVKLLLYAIQKTYSFEVLLHKRFVGTEPGAEGAGGAGGAEGTADGDALFEEESEGGAGGAGGGSPWVGLIGGCFEPHLSLYISSLDTNLRALMDRFVQEARSVAPEAAGAGLAAGAVFASCADLFLFYKKCLAQCARLTTGEPMLELAGVFQKYLREYASGVLQAALPRGAGSGGGGGGAPLSHLVTNLHTLLRDDAGAARYTKQEVAKIASVITTAEYCLETTVHLEQKLKEKVAPALAARVDLAPEQELFHRMIDDCIQLLVRDLELACEPALQAMARAPWAHVAAVGDQSPYVSQLVLQLHAAVPALRDHLASSRKYFTQLCIRFASSFIPKFIQNIYRCKPLSTAGAEQLLLDTHMLKTALLELPCAGAAGAGGAPGPGGAGGAVARAAPATYCKVVVRLMSRAEMILKLVLAPLEGNAEGFAAQVARLLPGSAPPDLHRLLELKGARLSRAQLAALDALFKEAANGKGRLDGRDECAAIRQMSP